MGTRKNPTTGAVDRIYGVLRSRPYEPMSIRAIMRSSGPGMNYHTVQGNSAHCRNRFFPYIRRVAPGVYMYTPGGALDNPRYPERNARPTATRDSRSPLNVLTDQTRAKTDAELTLRAMEQQSSEPRKEARVEEPVANHVTTVTYRVLGELKDGGVLLVDSDGDVWEIKRLVARSPR